MNIIITGSATGLGKAAVTKFCQHDSYQVFGLDYIGWIGDLPNNYVHHTINPSDESTFPDIPNVGILVNCLEFHDSHDDIDLNIKSTIAITSKYGLQPSIKSIVNISSASVHNGLDLPEFVAAKGSIYSYTKWVAVEIAKWGATCNSISVGGLISPENDKFIEDSDKFNAIMAQTPLKKWATCEEIADWIYMLSVINSSCSGQDIIIDNLESMNGTYIG